MEKRGFTLIELLVVVLIFGILASIALPQYQKSVEKSKATQAFAIIRSIAAAQEAYYMENDQYATSFDNLSVNIPWTGNVKWVDNSSCKEKSNEDWSVQLYRMTIGDGISIGRISGPYAGAGFVYLLSSSDEVNYPSKQLICMERYIRTDVPFTKEPHSYCKKLFPELHYRKIGDL